MKLEEEDKNILKLGRAFEAMKRTEGWHYYRQLLQAHHDTHTKAILTPNNDITSIFAGERSKGAVVGLQLALNLLDTICTQAEEIRKRIGEDPDAD